MVKGNSLTPIPPCFLDRLDLTHVGFGARPYVTLSRFRYMDTDGVIWEVPAGFASDMASLPWVVRALPVVGHGKSGPWDKAALLHDWHCTVRVLPSAEVHRMFGRMLTLCDMPAYRRTVFAAAVRAFGPRWPDPADAAKDAWKKRTPTAF